MDEDKIREDKIIKINAICGVFAIIFFVVIVQAGGINIIPYMIHNEFRLERMTTDYCHIQDCIMYGIILNVLR